MTTTASEKQISFITRLLNERDTCGTPYAMHREAPTHLTSRQASDAITALLALPKALVGTPVGGATAPAPRAEAPEGMHRFGGVIFKVQRAVHGSGNVYAKALLGDGEGGWRFEYASGAVRNLSTATLLTLEEAKEFGTLYGTCCVCGRTLTDEDSIAAGIGPVCATKF